MVQRRNMLVKDALLRDVPTRFRTEEYVSNMVQRRRGRSALMKDAPARFGVEVCVEDMAQS